MRSFAIYQIIATLATLALFSSTSVSALPVRGALGNLNTRARIARRANAANAATLGKRFKIATKQFDAAALPANPKAQLLKKVAAVQEAEKKVLHKKRDAGVAVDAVPSPVSSPASQTGIAPGASGMVLGLTRPSVIVRQQNIVAPAALAVVESSSSSSSDSSSSEEESDSSPAPAADQEAIYQSYIDALNDFITATVTVTSTSIVEQPSNSAVADVEAVAPTDFQVAAVVPVQSQAPAAPDAQAIYNSYVAQMNAAAASAS